MNEILKKLLPVFIDVLVKWLKAPKSESKPTLPTANAGQVTPKSELPEPQESIGLTLDDWLTSSGKYPERAKEATDEINANAEILLAKVNSLLFAHGIDKVSVSSGFRPASVNSKIPNAAKKSAHMSGKAIDLLDTDGKLKAAIGANPELLRSLGLFMEDPAACPGWCHLDCVERADRPNRIFKP